MDAHRAILLHGIWMRSPIVWVLARRLRAQGLEVATFDYASVLGGPAQGVRALTRRVGARGAAVHLVGHSLGGLLAVHACASGLDLRGGRVVCLGSPLAGSSVARQLGRYALGRFALGGFRELLLAGAVPPAGVDVGVIAGARPAGLGSVLSTLPAPHDGTVAVNDTRVDGLADHRVMPVSHTGMMLDPMVAASVLAFLRHGRFAGD